MWSYQVIYRFKYTKSRNVIQDQLDVMRSFRFWSMERWSKPASLALTSHWRFNHQGSGIPYVTQEIHDRLKYEIAYWVCLALRSRSRMNPTHCLQIMKRRECMMNEEWNCILSLFGVTRNRTNPTHRLQTMTRRVYDEWRMRFADKLM